MCKKICCFAGHSDLIADENLKYNLERKITELIENENVTDFWVGNYGSFDRLSSRIIKKLQTKYPHIKLILILPYITQNIIENKDYYTDYDNIVVADIPVNTPPKYRIIKCNRYMIDNSSFLIAYVKHPWGGAAQTFEYAQKKSHIITSNLAAL